MLSPIEAVGSYINDDVSTRNVVQTSPSSFRVFPASFG